MNSPHSLMYSVIALMLFSSIVSLVFVSFQNRRAVKKYYKALQAGEVSAEKIEYSYDPEDFEEINFFGKGTTANPKHRKKEKTREHATVL